MNIEYLKTFLALASNGNFTKTAQNLFISQSTVSIRIKELEKEIGKKLFERNHGTAVLTLPGKALVEYAEKIVGLEANAIEQASLAGTFSERLIVGTVYYFYDSFIADNLEDHLERHPDIAIRIVLGHSMKIIQSIGTGDLDIGFTHHPYNHPGYYCQLFNVDEMLLVTGAHNNQYINGISIWEVKNLPILYSSFLDHATENWIFPRQHLFSLDIYVGGKIVPFLKKGDRYTFLPKKLVEKELQEGTLINIPLIGNQLPPLENYIIYKRDNEKHATICHWIKWLRNILQNPEPCPLCGAE